MAGRLVAAHDVCCLRRPGTIKTFSWTGAYCLNIENERLIFQKATEYKDAWRLDKWISMGHRVRGGKGDGAWSLNVSSESAFTY